MSYDGSCYHGWQIQKNAITVQEVFQNAVEKVFGKRLDVTGCSRTDSGVHANEFCITIENEGGTVPADKLPVASVRFLPEDISLFYAKECGRATVRIFLWKMATHHTKFRANVRLFNKNF